MLFHRQIHIIAAVARNRAIGLGNRLLYRLPDDMRHFRQVTTPHTVIMGRKTFQSLPHGALPDRRNIVISRHPRSYEQCEYFTSIEQAVRSCLPTHPIYIIGGASLYEQTIAYADRLLLTLVDDKPAEADAFFPDYAGWQLVSSQHHPADERHKVSFSFNEYIPPLR